MQRLQRPASRIAFELNNEGIAISRHTVTRHLAQLGLERRRLKQEPAGNREELLLQPV